MYPDLAILSLEISELHSELERTMSGFSKKGTYSYMAPEMYKGEKYDSRVDIYSLGNCAVQADES